MEIEQPSAGSSKCKDCVGRAVWAVCLDLKNTKKTKKKQLYPSAEGPPYCFKFSSSL